MYTLFTSRQMENVFHVAPNKAPDDDDSRCRFNHRIYFCIGYKIVNMAMSVDVTSVLQACQSPDARQREHGEAKLKELEADPALYFHALSTHLATQNNPVDTRRLAGRQDMAVLREFR